MLSFQLIPEIIFKGARCPPDKVCGNRGTITYEIYHNLPDRWGNRYPPRDQVFLTTAPKASSNAELTIEYMKEVLFPWVGAVDGQLQRVTGLLCDAFSGHFAQEVKDHNAQHDLLNWLMMDGGITPKAQPLDVLINKIFKGYFRDLFEEWSLNAPINEKTGHPFQPSRQLLAQWVVAAWAKIPDELVRRAWEVCGYRSMDKLQEEARSEALVEYSPDALGSLVEKLCGEDGNNAWLDPENDPDLGPEESFPDDDDADDEWELASVSGVEEEAGAEESEAEAETLMDRLGSKPPSDE